MPLNAESPTELVRFDHGGGPFIALELQLLPSTTQESRCLDEGDPQGMAVGNVQPNRSKIATDVILKVPAGNQRVSTVEIDSSTGSEI